MPPCRSRRCRPGTRARSPGATGTATAAARSGSSRRCPQPFCGACTRARLSADGELFTCLFAARGADLKSPLRGRGRRRGAPRADPGGLGDPRRPLLRAAGGRDRRSAAGRDVRDRGLRRAVTLRVSAPAAPLGRRAVAFFLDGFVLVPIWIVYAVVLDAVFGPLVAADPGGAGVVVVAIDPPRVALELALTLLTDAAYYAGSWARWGMTPGQRACGVAVGLAEPAARRRHPDGGRPSPSPAASRPGRVVRWAVLQVLPLCVGSLGSAGALSLAVVAGITVGWSGPPLPVRGSRPDAAGGPRSDCGHRRPVGRTAPALTGSLPRLAAGPPRDRARRRGGGSRVGSVPARGCPQVLHRGENPWTSGAAALPHSWITPLSASGAPGR